MTDDSNPLWCCGSLDDPDVGSPSDLLITPSTIDVSTINHGKPNYDWLVVTGTMEFYDFPYFGNFIIPTDEVHHFSEG